MWLWVILGAVGVVVVGGGIFLFLRLRRPAEEVLFHFNCPHCKRRFRYRTKQAGNSVQCPQCRKQFTFPRVPGALK